MSNAEAVAARVDGVIRDWQDTIRRSNKVHVNGAQSKSGFHDSFDDAVTISTNNFSGIVSYDPQEFVVTVLGGTKVSDLVAILAKHGQYLPFDPLLADNGATIGGTVAANASGPGRFRYGGIRDFLLGVRFIDGRGNCIRGGGQVVKNAAGFDYPKLLIGSKGKLGLIYELTFKVFPQPECYATIMARFEKLEDAVSCMNQMAISAFDIEALDLVTDATTSPSYELAVRIGGIESAIKSRLAQIEKLVLQSRILRDQPDRDFWHAASHLEWADHKSCLVKLPITPTLIPAIEAKFVNSGTQRRYSVGGNVAWIATEWTDDWSNRFGEAQKLFTQENTSSSTRSTKPGPFGQAIKRAIDPDRKFV